ncbi:MAG: 5-formyltetrahydrofolate cyclo-ligase [Chthoniobacterales bacterium]
MLAKQKQHLRNQMKFLSQQADGTLREKESATLVEKLLLLPEWKKARTILLYAPLADEPDLLKICSDQDLKKELTKKDIKIPQRTQKEFVDEKFLRTKGQNFLSNVTGDDNSEKLAATILGKQNRRRFLFPRIQNEKLVLHQWKPHLSWIPNHHGLQEPDPQTWPLIPIEEVDLMLVPGMAFDRNGGRLGRGRGFFDRLLCQPECRASKIGVAWSWQMVEHVPREHFDVMMDAVLMGDRR